jgi:hypothetical protein
VLFFRLWKTIPLFFKDRKTLFSFEKTVFIGVLNDAISTPSPLSFISSMFFSYKKILLSLET